jgi:hypothetical protein
LFKRLPYARRPILRGDIGLAVFRSSAGATAVGAASVASLQTAFPEQKTAVTAAVHAAGARMSRFQLPDLNPLRWIYDYEIGEITSPTHKLDFPSSPPVVAGDPLKSTPVEIGQLGPAAPMKNGSFGGNMQFDPAGSPGLHSRLR